MTTYTHASYRNKYTLILFMLYPFQVTQLTSKFVTNISNTV